MHKKTSLLAVLIIGIVGVLFSGYLSFAELFQKTCPVGGCVFVLGLPSCVYGFVMYLAIVMLSALGLRHE